MMTDLEAANFSSVGGGWHSLAEVKSSEAKTI